jgi:hypothetical protein
MIALENRPSLNLDPEVFRESFGREPFGFTHGLSGLDLFEFGSLRTLAGKYRDEDHFVAAGAPSPGTVFYSVPHRQCTPVEALDRLETGSYRVLLKRPENYDPGYRDLLDALFHHVIDLRGGLGDENVIRLQGSILISSAATTTPFHFDPEIGFFSQIEGEKIYHVYSPTVLSEAELERFYVRGSVNIGQVDLAGRDPSREHVFNLAPGKGFHQPQNAPHWVETRGSRSVSYTFVFETDRTRKIGRVRGFNFFVRKVGLAPSLLGTRPAVEAAKAGMIDVVVPVAKKVKNTAEALFGR